MVEIINENCKNFIIANAYRPPDWNVSDFRDFIEAALRDWSLITGRGGLQNG